MKKKIVAEFKRWDGKIEKRKIKKSWIDDIVFAVEVKWLLKIIKQILELKVQIIVM